MKILTNAYSSIKDPLWIWLIHKKFESLMWTTTIHYLFMVAKIQLFQTGLTLQCVKLKREHGQRFRFSDWINSIVYQEGVDAKRSHTKAREPHTPSSDCTWFKPWRANQFTCKLTRKQQTVKFKSVSTGFPNHSHAAYRQGSADTENDSRSDIKSM